MNSESDPTVVATACHPRRPPAHLSVSLKHTTPDPIEKEKPDLGVVKQDDTSSKPRSNSTSPFRQRTSDDSEDTVPSNVNEWFDHANTRPVTAVNQDSGDVSKFLLEELHQLL